MCYSAIELRQLHLVRVCLRVMKVMTVEIALLLLKTLVKFTHGALINPIVIKFVGLFSFKVCFDVAHYK
jgi:hypothetical protein